MKKFILKVLLFIFFVPIILFGSYFSVDTYLNRQNGENGLFIWGDSQMYQGVDLSELSARTGENVFSSARHGAGVYDFLVFTEKVPDHSKVIIALSKPAIIRKKNRDRNISGLSISSLFLLWNNGYSFDELISIVNKNRQPTKLFTNNSILFPESDSIVLSEPLSLFEDAYSSIPNYFDDKQAIYISGIKTLKRKQCDIILLDFPFHPLLKEIENRSILISKSREFEKMVLRNFEVYTLDTIHLDLNKELMYDLTHLNKKGAFDVSMELSEKIKIKEPVLYRIQWRD